MSGYEEDDNVIHQTEKWLREVVIANNFCPFARREDDKGSIRYKVIHEKKSRDILQALISELHFLDENPQFETSLLIFNGTFKSFYDFLEVLDLSEQLLSMENYEGVYQIASFHPDYIFADADMDDAANYTNRSLWPMLHILREESLESAIASHPDAEGIPNANIAKARKLGAEHFISILAKCRSSQGEI